MGEVIGGAFVVLLLGLTFFWFYRRDWDFETRMRLFAVRGIMQAKTITGKEIEYLLVAHAHPEGRAEHLGHRLYSEEGQQEWLWHFNRHVFLPTMAQHDFFFAQTWLRRLVEDRESGQHVVLPVRPWGVIYQATRDNGTIRAKMSPGGHGVSEIIKQTQTMYWGCRVSLLFVQEVGVWSDDLAERNYKMLTPADIAAIQEDDDFRRIDEDACTLARYRELEAKRRLESQTHTIYDWIKVHARWAPGSGVFLTWTVTKWPSAGVRLLGFRREEKFVGNGFVDQENGVRILDTTNGRGETLDVVVEGQTYCYTFLFRGRDTEGAVADWGPLRFTLFTPPEVKPPPPEPEEVSPVLRQGRAALRNVGDYMQITREVEQMLQQDIEEIKGMKLPEKDEKGRILQLETVYNRVLQRLQSHVA